MMFWQANPDTTQIVLIEPCEASRPELWDLMHNLHCKSVYLYAVHVHTHTTHTVWLRMAVRLLTFLGCRLYVANHIVSCPSLDTCLINHDPRNRRGQHNGLKSFWSPAILHAIDMASEVHSLHMAMRWCWLLWSDTLGMADNATPI